MRPNTHYNYSGNSHISGKHRSKLERDKEFNAIYRQVLNFMIEHKVPNARQAAVRFTVLHSHPHYHVSYDRAYIVVSKILKGQPFTARPSLRASMWLEIAKQVKYLHDNHNISIARATEWVIENCTASRFFISPEHAYHHIPHRQQS